MHVYILFLVLPAQHSHYELEHVTVALHTVKAMGDKGCILPILQQTQVVNVPDWALGPTVVTVDLSYTNYTQVLHAKCMHFI